jgi:hypothetical protein
MELGNQHGNASLLHAMLHCSQTKGNAQQDHPEGRIPMYHVGADYFGVVMKAL